MPVSEYLTVAETLCRAKAMTAGTTYAGDWHDIASARDIDFWLRMTSAGSPSLKVSVDVSPFRTFTADKWAVPPAEGSQPATTFDPSSNYLTVDLNDAFATVFNGSDANGGWTEINAPPAMKNGFAHYSSLRYRIVCSTANATTVDFIMTRAAR